MEIWGKGGEGWRLLDEIGACLMHTDYVVRHKVSVTLFYLVGKLMIQRREIHLSLLSNL